jgi:hypothetical protein
MLDHKKIINSYKELKSITQIAKDENVSDSLIRKVLITNKVVIEKRFKTDLVDPEPIIKRYEELRKAPLVAKEFNISTSSVLKILHENNVRVSVSKYGDKDIIDYYKKVKQINKVCDDLGISDSKVFSVFKKYNVKRETLKRIEPGDKFNQLTVIEQVGYYVSTGNNKHRLFKCLCDCGNYINVKTNQLTSKIKPKKNCGCVWEEKLKTSKLKRYEIREGVNKRKKEKEIKRIEKELNKKPQTKKKYKVGDKHHRLTILSEINIDNNKFFTVECECGTIKKIRRTTIGITKSCGCLQKERSSTHGMSSKYRKWYDRWKGMIRRCYNPKSHSYHNYGGRGIKVCDRWLEPNGKGCENFYNDIHEILGPQPSPEHSLDRTDNDGMYEIINLRWATNSEQTKNQRRFKK